MKGTVRPCQINIGKLVRPCPDKVALHCVLLTFLIQVGIFAALSRMGSSRDRNDGVKVGRSTWFSSMEWKKKRKEKTR